MEDSQVLKQLLDNKQFLALLSNSARDRRRHTDTKDDEFFDAEKLSTSSNFERENGTKVVVNQGAKSNKFKMTLLHHKIAEFEKLIYNLSTFMKIALETFLLQGDEPTLAFLERSGILKTGWTSSPYAVRDAQVLFTVKRVIYNLSSCVNEQTTIDLKINTVNRLCIAGRALCRLIKCFTIRLNNLDASSLPHLFHFAVCVHELSRQYLEYATRLSSLEHLTEEFEKMLDYFQLQVVLGLKEKRNTLLTVLEQKLEKNFLQSTQTITRPRRKLVCLKPTTKPKGYLLPLDLRVKREKIQSKIASEWVVADRRTPERQISMVVSPTIDRKYHKLSIPERTVVEASAYASKVRRKSELNRHFFGLPAGASTSTFAEKLTDALIEEAIAKFENELSLCCEEIVDYIYDSETRYQQNMN